MKARTLREGWRPAGMDHVLLFPILRSLTVLPNLEMLDPVAAYARRMSERSGVPLVGALRKDTNP